MSYLSSVSRPNIPYSGSVNGNLHVGKLIDITGIVPYGADVFTINLTTGRDSMCDRPLHLSVRFSGRVVVRNTLQYNQWGSEERTGDFPFTMGRQFNLRILVQQSSYAISVDGRHCWTYNHRIPMSRVSSILIDGTVGIDRIDFINCAPQQPAYQQPAYHQPAYQQPAYQQPAYQQPAYPAYPAAPQVITMAPIYNPSIPYTCPLPGGLKTTTKIYISAKPCLALSLEPHRFTINLQCGSAPYPPPDIAFHFDVRFYNNTIVRNTRTNGQWGPEELTVPNFPFQTYSQFDMLIRLNNKKFMVSVNGQEFIEYHHRIRPLSCIDTLFIEKNVSVSTIRFG